jgi:hypothetical protein
MTFLHFIDMTFLFLSFAMRISFFWTIERKVRRPTPMKIPLLIWAIFGLMVIFVIPRGARVDVALYAIAGPLMFWVSFKWRDIIQDYQLYRQAEIAETDRLPYLRGEWKRR